MCEECLLIRSFTISGSYDEWEAVPPTVFLRGNYCAAVASLQVYPVLYTKNFLSNATDFNLRHYTFIHFLHIQ